MPLTGLPTTLQKLFDDPLPPSRRVLQCQTLALILATVESRQLDAAQESAWIRAAATHLFSSNMYKVLMWAATPGIVFRTANVRWSAFFKGTSLSSDVVGRTALVHPHVPRAMFNDDLAHVFIDVIWAAVNDTREESGAASLTLDRHDETGTSYRGAW